MQRPVLSHPPHPVSPEPEAVVKLVEPTAVPATATPDRATELSGGWPFAAALVLSAIFWLIAWYGDTAESMVAIWVRSETFTHGFLILPITAWMIWRRRHVVAALEPRPNFLALPLLALVGFGWLMGRLASADVVQQFAVVLMIPLLVWMILGSQVVRTLAFPLFFLLFAVPFGEFLVPSMMAYTADFTVSALRLTGIPVYREGQFFTLPTGSWSVVEACAGLRYLIASLTVGFLYAYLMYRSLMRRVLFLAASVIVPIVANWLRAYMIVMIGHRSSMKYAVGVDHLIYGWLFFGVVMLILLWIGSFWREDLDPEPAVPDSVALVLPGGKSSMRAVMAATVAAAVMVVVWPVAAARLEGPYGPMVLQAPLPAEGWQPMAGSLTNWTPHFINPAAQINQVYAEDGTRVGLYIGYYHGQRQGAELIASQNTLVHSFDRVWRNAAETQRVINSNHERIALTEAQLRGRSTGLLVWRWYWVDGRHAVNPYWVKLLQAKSQLLGDGDDGAVVIVYTEFDTDREAAAARLQDFVNAMLPAIGRSLDNVR
jgi:exosortase A